MKQYVWVVVEWFSPDNWGVYGIYSTEQLAKNACKHPAMGYQMFEVDKNWVLGEEEFVDFIYPITLEVKE